MPSKQSTHSPPSALRIRRVNEILLARYGEKTAQQRDPLDGLIVVLLSQATNDLNCDRAFSSLKARFPSWEEVLAAPLEQVIDAIRCGGLANQKGARIQQLLREIDQQQGNLDLSWMFDAPAQECRDFLSQFKGVGPKTVACVLLFFLQKPAFPVDTHVHRVCKRLGWIREIAGTDEAHKVLEAAVPDDCALNLHINIIQHGRAICRANGNGGPRCQECVLAGLCDFAEANHPALFRSRKRKPLQTVAPLPVNSDFFVTVE